jgi:hypothetical protein
MPRMPHSRAAQCAKQTSAIPSDRVAVMLRRGSGMQTGSRPYPGAPRRGV